MVRKSGKPSVGSIRSQKAIVANVAHIYDSAQWVPTERDLAVEIIKELENRRVLYNDYELEVPASVVTSIIQMREVFHAKLLTMRDEGALANHLRSMRAACRKFLDIVGDGPHRIIIQSSFQGGPESWKFFTALGELRAAIGVALSPLMAAYDLTCESQVSRILPADPADGSQS